jgi:hypothetical protein
MAWLTWWWQGPNLLLCAGSLVAAKGRGLGSLMVGQRARGCFVVPNRYEYMY